MTRQNYLPKCEEEFEKYFKYIENSFQKTFPNSFNEMKEVAKIVFSSGYDAGAVNMLTESVSPDQEKPIREFILQDIVGKVIDKHNLN